MLARTERRNTSAVSRLSLTVAITTIMASIASLPAHAQVSSYVYVAADGGLRLIEAATGQPLSEVFPHRTFPTNLVVSSDGRRVFITGGAEAGT